MDPNTLMCMAPSEMSLEQILALQLICGQAKADLVAYREMTQGGKEENTKLRLALDAARKALKYSETTGSLDDPYFGYFTPLQFAARLGLINIKAREALAKIEEALKP